MKKINYKPVVTADDVNREELSCWLCGDQHVRAECPEERLFWGRSRNKKPAALAVDKMDDPVAARLYWQWLWEQGWVN